MVEFVIRTLLARLRTPPAAAPVQPEPWLQSVESLRMRVGELERSEATRNAEHAAMVDQLDRLYKRISSRIARSNESSEPTKADGESVLSLRNRLGR